MRASFDVTEALYRWLGIPFREQPANYYRLLGLALIERDPGVIESAADCQTGAASCHLAGGVERNRRRCTAGRD